MEDVFYFANAATFYMTPLKVTSLWWNYPLCKQMVWKFTMTIRLVNHISLAVKPKNVIANTAGSAGFHFMFVAEQPLSCHSSSIV